MGTVEILVILLIYLLLFGAKGVPSMARTLGGAIRQMRSATDEIQREILSTSKPGEKPKKPPAPKPADQMPGAATNEPPATS
jgi:sec-independent protein translocase protein TatA